MPVNRKMQIYDRRLFIQYYLFNVGLKRSEMLVEMRIRIMQEMQPLNADDICRILGFAKPQFSFAAHLAIRTYHANNLISLHRVMYQTHSSA